jgi:hypothetical protein
LKSGGYELQRRKLTASPVHLGLSAEDELVGGCARRRENSADGMLNDLHGFSDYRANLIKVMAQRALAL